MKMVVAVRKMALMLMSCSGLLWMNGAGAVDVQIKITGEIHIPPCKVTSEDGPTLKVSFNKIALQKVDGQNYAKTDNVLYLDCEYYQGKPYIRLEGNVMPGAADNVLRTEGANPSSLGIALYQGDGVNPSYPLRVGAGEQGKYGYEIRKGLSAVNARISNFTFTAVPYKQGSGDLQAGTFTAAVTMSVSYL